jgi:hypothetical protein
VSYAADAAAQHLCNSPKLTAPVGMSDTLYGATPRRWQSRSHVRRDLPIVSKRVRRPSTRIGRSTDHWCVHDAGS